MEATYRTVRSWAFLGDRLGTHTHLARPPISGAADHVILGPYRIGDSNWMYALPGSSAQTRLLLSVV